MNPYQLMLVTRMVEGRWGGWRAAKGWSSCKNFISIIALVLCMPNAFASSSSRRRLPRSHPCCVRRRQVAQPRRRRQFKDLISKKGGRGQAKRMRTYRHIKCRPRSQLRGNAENGASQDQKKGRRMCLDKCRVAEAKQILCERDRGAP